MLHERLAQGASEFPETPCIIEAETGRTLTYAECLDAVQALRQLIGSEPRGIVMALPSGATNGLLWLSALTGGHTLAPLPPDAGAAERRRAVQLVRPDLLVVERAEDAEAFACPGARRLTRQDCERAIAAALPARVGSTANRLLPAREGRVCLMTSGSTGEPKGVLLTERQIAWTADQLRRSHRLSAGDRGLTVLPLFHVNAPVVSLCASICAGATVVIARRFSRSQFWQWIQRYQITWASLVPTILAMLLETERPGFLPGSLRFVRTASAPLPVVHLLAFERKFGIPVVETYGLSEAAATVAANPVPPARRKPGAVGLPVGVELRICRPRAGAEPEPLVDVAPGKPGEICVRGPSVIKGYVGGAGAAAFQDGWFRTGDLGYQDADGYLYITGRLRDVIIRGGENIAPREIEEVLLADPLIRDAAVVGRPDPLYGQQVVAYVVPQGRWGAETEQAVRTRCARALSSYKIPAAFVPVARLPRTRSGKIQRHRLVALSALPRLALLAGLFSDARVRLRAAEGVTSAVTTAVTTAVASTVTSTMARLQQVRVQGVRVQQARLQQARRLQRQARPVKLAIESSPHHYSLRVTTLSHPTAQRAAIRQGIGSMGAETRPVVPAVTSAVKSDGDEAGHAGARKGKGRRPYVYELDPMRVVTALAVVGVHVLTFAAILNTTPLGIQIQLGLGSALHFTREIFMFTTAFVLVYTYAGVDFDLKTFIRKRGMGVVVPYVIWSLIYLWLNRSFVSPGQFVLSAIKVVLSGNASYQLYYILLTIQFYAIFPLLLLALPWIRRHQWTVLGVSCALELILLGLDYTYLQTPPIATTWWGALLNYYQDRFLPIYQFYFILGAVAALNFDRTRAFVRRHGRIILVMAMVALTLLWVNYALAVWWLHQPSDYASSVLQPELLPYSLAVLAFLGWLACTWAARRDASVAPHGARFWRTLADAAFGIYLVHPLILSLVLRAITPWLPAALPVALRVILIWALVGGLSAALSVLLLRTPVLSRLVGRPAPLPLREALARVARRGPVAKPSQQPAPALGASTQTAARVEIRPDEAATALASADRELQLASAGASASRARSASRWEAAPSMSHPSLSASSPRSSGTRVVAVRLDAWPRVTRPLPIVEVAARSGVFADMRSGITGKEHADVVEGSDVKAPRGAQEATDVRAARQGPRDERRRKASTLRQQGWKQKDIAVELGVSASTVSGWLRREHEDRLAAADVARQESADEMGAARMQREITASERR